MRKTVFFKLKSTAARAPVTTLEFIVTVEPNILIKKEDENEIE